MKKVYTIKTRRLFECDSAEPFKISRSQIEAFCECPRCFWLNHRAGLRRPSGPPFTINSLVDTNLKHEFDVHRAAQTPHPIMTAHGLDMVPFAHPDMDDWRFNFKGLQYNDQENNLVITGAIDDIWQHRVSKQLVIVDYKATAKNGEITLDEEWKISYKRQMEIYIWILRKLGYDVDDTGFFVYANGQERPSFENRLDFTTTLLPYTGNSDWVAPKIEELKACLMMDTAPAAPEDCEYCGYIAAMAAQAA